MKNEQVGSVSATPRTDAAAIGFARFLVDKDKWSTTELIESNFARQLERELAQARAELLRERAAHEADNKVANHWLACFREAEAERDAYKDAAQKRMEERDALAADLGRYMMANNSMAERAEKAEAERDAAEDVVMDIYGDFDGIEVGRETKSVQNAWKLGAAIDARKP